MSNTIDTGKIIKTYFDTKRIKKAALARAMQTYPASVAGFANKKSINTAVLQQLCDALQHNFFQDITQLLPSTYITTQNIFENKDLEILQLQEEVKKLKHENEILLKVLGK